MIKNIKEKYGFHVTINTTEDCNLSCSYCYEFNKTKRTIKFEYVEKFIDFLLNDPDPAGVENAKDSSLSDIYNGGLIIEFIGGDSFMNVDIMDKTLKYLILKLQTLDTKLTRLWRDNYRVSISTNGTLFAREDVRNFCMKYKNVLNIGISIDGCPEIHDKYRIFPNGKGSLSVIMDNFKWFRENFPEDSLVTKSTCSKESIPYLCDSLVFMHETLGLKYINQNFIMEDTGCTEKDYKLLKEQMDKCLEYVYQHKDELYWSMIDEDIFAKHSRSTGDDWHCKGKCGSGAMPALSIDGDIYPCFRWLPHTQKTSGVMKVGDIQYGFNHKENFEKVRVGAIRCNCTKEEKCRTCEYESACSYCIGGCYAEYGNFTRTTHICEITKIQCEAAKKYWKRIHSEEL